MNCTTNVLLAGILAATGTIAVMQAKPHLDAWQEQETSRRLFRSQLDSSMAKLPVVCRIEIKNGPGAPPFVYQRKVRELCERDAKDPNIKVTWAEDFAKR